MFHLNNNFDVYSEVKNEATLSALAFWFFVRLEHEFTCLEFGEPHVLL